MGVRGKSKVEQETATARGKVVFLVGSRQEVEVVVVVGEEVSVIAYERRR